MCSRYLVSILSMLVVRMIVFRYWQERMVAENFVSCLLFLVSTLPVPVPVACNALIMILTERVS